MGFSIIPTLSLLCLSVVLTGAGGDGSPETMKDRAALVSFMAGVSDPENSLHDWNSSSVYVCNWTGVNCSSNGDRVVKLDLSGKSLEGTISTAICNLSSLIVLDLSLNYFHGGIPQELGSLVKLRTLTLSKNQLEGAIPGELGFLQELGYLNMADNRLTGEIPEQLLCNGSSNLTYLDLSRNNFTGISIGNHCRNEKLTDLMLWSNRLAGRVPQVIANLTKLRWLDLSINMLEGELPSGIVSKLPFLEILDLSDNHFESHDGNSNLQPFFASLVNSSKLQELDVAGNKLQGEIPPIIGHLSVELRVIQLDSNRIHGSIPTQLSKLVNVTLLNLSFNLLSGIIPHEMCRMAKLERVFLSKNFLSGEIPPALGYLPKLGLLDLSKNKLSGSIPDSFAKLRQFRNLYLYGNQLSGSIPSSLGNCITLEVLDLSHNQFSGVIPTKVAALKGLTRYLNLSSNHLTGPLPLELSKLVMVPEIDLSCNNLSGAIPPQIEGCVALQYLNLSGNSLDGTLPDSMGKLPSLEAFDVSRNQLSGEIPKSLQDSSTLKQLNFSSNKFSGTVPSQGVFSWLTVDSFLDNKDLCGSIKGMPKCRGRRKHRLLLPLLLSFLAALFVAWILLVIKRQIRKHFGFKDAEKEDRLFEHPRISYEQLIKATDGFSSSSLIGSGRFGHVYKGVLPDNTRIAVKVLDIQTTGDISGSFKRECQVLRRTRHRNLITIITTCSRPDFKALVLPLMSNGSLEGHLYPTCSLNLVQLLSICSDVAEGVAYLHHHSHIRVVHCDLKPSNILLDDDLKAVVTDFGISRLIVDDINSSNNSTSLASSTSCLLYGSLGYIAPEYGLGKRASTQGDVFSYGVLLLEIIAGRRPTDMFFQNGPSLHEWVKSCYPYKLDHVIEEAMRRYGVPAAAMGKQEGKIWREVILEMIELGIVCTQFSPSARPNMEDIAHDISKLKAYLSESLCH